MKNKTNGCWMHRMHAIAIIVIIYLMTLALSPSHVKNSCRTDFAFGQAKVNTENQNFSCPQQQKNGETGNRDTLISTSYMSRSQMPNAPYKGVNSSSRYDLPLLETQDLISVEYCVAGRKPTYDFDSMHSFIATSTKFQFPTQLSERFPRDKLHKYSKAISYVEETHIAEYIKEVISILSNQQEHLLLQLYKISESNFLCTTFKFCKL